MLSFVMNSLLAQTSVPGGSVSGTWTKDNSPYQVEGDITINDNEILTIEPGVVVEFQDYYRFFVYGTLVAEGDKEDTITFTKVDTTGFYNRADSVGKWGGIRFNGGANSLDNDTTIFSYCKFEYAASHGTSNNGGALYVSNLNRIKINNNLFKDNFSREGGAMYIANSIFTIEENTFKYNEGTHSGGGVYIYNSNIDFINNLISYNTGYYHGGGVKIYSGSPYVANNIINYNETESGGGHDGGGGIYITASSNAEIVKNFITNNISTASGGGVIVDDSNPVLTNNIICNNDATSNAGGVYIIDSEAKLISNTIANNESASGGGGITAFVAHPEIYNTIIYGNSPNQVRVSGLQSYPSFYYSNIENGLAGFSGVTDNVTYENNIDADPDFESPTADVGSSFDGLAADWNITENSPCFNVGTPDVSDFNLPEKDIYENLRISNTYIDIGAAEKHIQSDIVNSDITVNTNWFTDTIYIESDIQIDDDVVLTINPGTIVQFNGHYQIDVFGTIIAEGTENDTILFTCHPDSTASGWNGIEYYNNGGELSDNDSSIYNYCKFQYSNHTENGGGVFFINFYSNILLSNSEFCYNSIDPGIGVGGGTIYGYFSSPEIRDCYFHNNTATRGSAISLKNSESIISGNIFTNNESLDGSSECLRLQSTNVTLTNNIIKNNIGKGISFYNSNTNNNIMSNNIIVNNSNQGIFSSSKVVGYNNTISNNANQGLALSGGETSLMNTIIWGNNTEIIISSGLTTLNLENCILENGIENISNGLNATVNHENIIDANPQFINPSSGNGNAYETVYTGWNLYDISPGIDMGSVNTPTNILEGNDLENKNRVNGIKIDIGAFENHGQAPVIIQQPVNQVLCEGDTVIFETYTQDTTQLQWYKDGNEIMGETNNTLVINGIDITDEANYSCIATNTYGNIESNNVVLILKTPPEIVVSNAEFDLCENDDLLLDFNLTGTTPITLQWQKDEVDMVDETSLYYQLRSAAPANSGLYRCIAENSCGIDTSESYEVNINPLPIISLGNDTTICSYTGYTLDGGAEMLSYQWNNYSTGRYLPMDSTGTYFARITNENGCINYTDTVDVTVTYPYDQQEICMVTIDPETNKNHIIWSKPIRDDIVYFNLYKEGSADVYNLLAQIPYNNVSEYVDTLSNPEVKSDRYKISIIDTCGNESELSDFHKTMHLTVNQGTGGETNLIWENYEGFYFGKYYIYRGTKEDNMVLIDSIQSNLTTYTDLNPPAGNAFYQIIIEKDDPCVLDTKGKSKTSGGPYAHSVSNIDDYANEVTCFPVAGENLIVCETLQGNLNGLLTYENSIGSWSCPTAGVIFSDENSLSSTITVPSYGTYTLTLTEINDNCTSTDELEITFSEAPGILDIQGLDNVIENEIESYYVDENINSTYNWEVNSGEIITGQGSNYVEVKWISNGNGLIQVIETNQNGCSGSASALNINIYEEGIQLCNPNAGSDTIYCSELTATLNGLFSHDTASGYWMCSDSSVIFSDSSDLKSTVTVPEYGIYTISLIENSTNCEGNDIVELVFSSSPVITSIIGNKDAIINETASYYVNENLGSIYNWNITNGEIISGTNSNYIEVKWTNLGTGNLSVTETNQYGCVGNLFEIEVEVVEESSITCIPDAGTDAIYCDLLSASLSGTLSNDTATGYWISTNANAIINDSTDLNTTITVSEYGSYLFSLVEKNGDCEGIDHVEIIFAEQPNISTIKGDEEAIIDEITSYYVNETIGSTYTWEITNGEILTGQGSSLVQVKWNESGTISVTEESSTTCMSELAILDVTATSVGINDINNVKNIHIYPNPTSDNIYLHFNLDSQQEIKIDICSVLGNEIILKPTTLLNQGEHNFEFQIAKLNLKKGIYFVRISGKKTNLSKKLLVR